MESVAAVSAADRDSLPARLADRAVCIGPAPAGQSYLRPEVLVAAARGTGCDAIHPGYGFLSERAAFQRLCTDAGLTFVGPDADAIEQMGDKIRAIAVARKAGVPVVPGKNPIGAVDEFLTAADQVGYPCLIKAAAGGGGRGMRVVRRAGEGAVALQSAQAEAKAAFGDGTLYMEKYIERARHVEIQILADAHGNVCHLFERDCSVQRRHQKLIEEAPSPSLSPRLRSEMAQAALALARAARYRNAGTVEFVYDVEAERFYFLEMNTRVQVEHPVTEAVTGIDIVQEQLRIAAGEPLSFGQPDVRLDGHAIECRINAEDAWKGFLPSPGTITQWDVPRAEGIRVDTHCERGYRVPPFYDSMIAKVISHGRTREEAIARMRSCLASFGVGGVATTVPFLRKAIAHPRFEQGEVTTTWVERELLSDIGAQANG